VSAAANVLAIVACVLVLGLAITTVYVMTDRWRERRRLERDLRRNRADLTRAYKRERR
jgi:hypothetical protein